MGRSVDHWRISRQDGKSVGLHTSSYLNGSQLQQVSDRIFRFELNHFVALGQPEPEPHIKGERVVECVAGGGDGRTTRKGKERKFILPGPADGIR
jgi:hypothetical protein